MRPAIRRVIPFRISAWIIVSVSLFVAAISLNKVQKNSLYASYQGCTKNYDDSLRLCWNADGKIIDLFENGGLVIHKNFSKGDQKDPSRIAKQQ